MPEFGRSARRVRWRGAHNTPLAAFWVFLLWMAVLAPQAAFAQTTIAFTNASGVTVTNYTVADDLVFISLTDAAVNTNPELADRVNVVVTSATGDRENVTLVETGVATGIFQNQTGLVTRLSSATSNGILDVTANSSIAVTFTNPADSTDTASASATVKNKLTASSVVFTDASGTTQTQYQIGTQQVFVKVTDLNANIDATKVDTVSVNLVDSKTGDVETVTLSETGLNTGIFRNTTGLVNGVADPVSGNGTVETANGSNLSANYTDPSDSADTSTNFVTMRLAPTPSVVFFCDSSGNAKSQFLILTDGVFVQVQDADQNSDPATAQTVGVRLTDSNTGESEGLTLTETGKNTGVFRNTTALNTALVASGSATQNNGTLQVKPGDTVLVSYSDNSTSPPDTASSAATFNYSTKSTTTLTDQAGNARTQYLLGVDPIYVTVVDANAGSLTSPPPTVKTVQVSVVNSVTLDRKVITLTEIAQQIGTFRNLTPLNSKLGPPANSADANNIYVAGNSQITASYIDPGDNTDSSSSKATMATPPTVSSVFFSDQNGNLLSTTVVTSGLYATVNDQAANNNPTIVEQVTANLTDGVTGDTEPILLQETGVNTGIFRNANAVPMKIGLAATDGVIETSDGSVVTVNYNNPRNASPVSAQITVRRGTSTSNPRTATFTDATGVPVSSYPIANPGKAVFVTVNEPDANLNPSVVDTVTVRVTDTNPAQGDQVTITLTEVDPVTGLSSTNSGLFRNANGIQTVLSTPPQLDNILQVRSGDTLAIIYQPVGGLSPSAPSTTATVILQATGAPTLAFTDISGNTKSVFQIGLDLIYISVTDAAQNKNPALAETVKVSLASSITSDQETQIVLTETGLNTGIFRNNGLASVKGLSTSNNGTLETAGGAIITADFADPDTPANTASSTARMAVVAAPATQLVFRTAASPSGTTTTTYFAYTPGLDQIFLRLTAADQNQDPTSVDRVPITLVATAAPVNDTQSVSLTETGANTGVFESTSGVPVTIGPSTANNGTIEGKDGGTVTATYRNPSNGAFTLSATAGVSFGLIALKSITFSDVSGNPKTSFVPGTDPVFVKIEAPNQNRDPGAVDTAQVKVTSSVGDSLTVNLTETGPNTAIFINTDSIVTALGGAKTDNILQVAGQSNITATFTDPRFPSNTGSAQALITVVPSPSTVIASDTLGNPKGSFTIGLDPIFATVTDKNRDLNPLAIDTVTVSLSSKITGDVVVATLVETGVSTGVFRNSTGIVSAVRPANADSIFDCGGGDLLTIVYVDPFTPSDSSTFVAQMLLSPAASSIVFFNTPASTVTTTTFQIGVENIYTRVLDTSELKNPTTVETVQVTLKDKATGDTETQTLTEVDVNGQSSSNGVRFETLTGFPSAIDLTKSGDSIVQTGKDSLLLATYTQSTNPSTIATAAATMVSAITSPTIQFTDVSGNRVTQYPIGDPKGVFVTVVDSMATTIASTSTPSTVLTSIFDQTTGDIVALTLTELKSAGGVFNTGVFRNSKNLDSVVGLPPTDVTTKLFTADKAKIIASYLNSSSPLAKPPSTAQAFDPTIQTILTKRGPNGRSCFQCHSDDNTQGQLNITGFRDLTRGGARGNPVVAGNSKTSLVIRKLETTTQNPLALPHPETGSPDPGNKVGGVITQDDLNRLKAWIDQGAVAPTLPTSFTYAQVQAQVFTPSCVSRAGPSLPACHDSANQAGGIILQDQTGFLNAIAQRNAAVLGNGPGSRMVQVLVDPALNHSGVRIDKPLGDPQHLDLLPAQLLSEFISQQFPASTPRPPLREYSGDVQPYFDRNCTTTGCHNRKDLAGGLDLTSYGGLSRGGKSGVTVSPGNVPGSKLLTKINKILDPTHTAVIPAAFFSSQAPTVITSWVNQGAFAGPPSPLSGPPSGAVTTVAEMVVGPSTDTVEFTDVAGKKVTLYQIATDDIYITLTAADLNRNPTITQEAQVVLTDSRTNDTETVSLTQIAPGSSQFRNKTALKSVVAAAQPNDGIVQTLNNSTLVATFTDPVFPQTVQGAVTMSTAAAPKVRFIDTAGTSVGIYSIGVDPVILEVTDLSLSGSARLNSGQVSLVVSPTGDQEKNSLVMTEVAATPGVFRSQQLSTINRATPSLENGQIETTQGGTLTLSYTSPNVPGFPATATANTKLPATNPEITFTDTRGVTKTSFTATVDPIFVTVRSLDRNVSPTTSDTIEITVFADQLGDSELITLTEVGQNTGIFRNTTGLPIVLATSGSPGDKSLQIQDTGAASVPIKAQYQNTVNPATVEAFANVVFFTPAIISFTNASGVVQSKYNRGTDLIYVTLAEPDRNLSSTVVDTVSVFVTDNSTSPGDVETLSLVETGKNTSIFRNNRGLPSTFGFPAAVPGNGVLETRINSFLYPGQFIVATFQDAKHPANLVNTTAGVWAKNPQDSDDDAIPDSFELQYALNPFDPSDARVDSDADGYTNLEEYLQGTNPRDGTDNAPTASAGGAQTVEPGYIALNGSASEDPQNRTLSYHWTQINIGQSGHGPAVVLSNPNAAAPTFLGFGGKSASGADLSRYDFNLTVANARKTSLPSQVNITVNNVPPTPFAGCDAAISLGDAVTLNGLESADANNETSLLQFLWSQPPGIPDFTRGLKAPSVTPTRVGVNTFTLTNTDPAGNRGSSRVNVTVHSPTNHVPLASVGPLFSGKVGSTITIDGSASADADPGDVLSYHWEISGAPDGADNLAPLPPDSTTPRTTILPQVSGYYTVSLTVSDQSGNQSAPVTAAVVVDGVGSANTPANRVPLAVATAPATGLVGGAITLDGSKSSDAERATLFYQWTQTRGVHVALSSDTVAKPTFIPVSPGVYAFDLQVSDGVNFSAPAHVVIAVNSGSQHLPTANAGVNQIGQIGTPIILNGSASQDVDGDSLSYYWHQLSGPGVALGNRDSVRPTLLTQQPGTYVFELVTYDQKNFSLPSQTTVQVDGSGGGTTPPVVIRLNGSGGSTATLTETPGRTVELDASASSATAGGTLTFAWVQTSGPGVILRNADTATPSFTPTAAGTYQFGVTVSDTLGNRAAGSVTVFVGNNNGTTSGTTNTAASGGGAAGGCALAPMGSGGRTLDLTILVWLVMIAGIRRRR
jgi:hypothetical protein